MPQTIREKVGELMQKARATNDLNIAAAYGIEALGIDPETNGNIKDRDVMENGLIRSFNEKSIPFSLLARYAKQGNKFAIKALVSLADQGNKDALKLSNEILEGDNEDLIDMMIDYKDALDESSASVISPSVSHSSAPTYAPTPAPTSANSEELEVTSIPSATPSSIPTIQPSGLIHDIGNYGLANSYVEANDNCG